MKPESREKVQNAFLAAILGAIIPVAIGFGGGCWVTSKTAEQMASGALLAAQAKICIAQFTSAPNYPERLKEFKSLDYSLTGAFIERGGWGRMPGEEKTSDAVKEVCSRGLEACCKNSPANLHQVRGEAQ